VSATGATDSGEPRTPRDFQRQWLAHRKERNPDARPDVIVGIAASFTAEPVESQAGAQLLDAGFADPEIRFADYNQIHQVCLDPAAHLGGDVDVLVLLWRIEDVFERQFARFLGGDDATQSALVDDVAQLAALVVALATSSAATLVVSTPPLPAGWGIDLRDVTTSLRVGQLHREVMTTWLDVLTPARSIEIIDLDALQRAAGEENIFDPQKWAMYRQPYRSTWWLEIGRQIEEAVVRRTTPAPKCIVLDCDNTLWGGVVGEDGIGGLQLGDTFPGRAFQAFQRELQMLESRGIMLAIASKNNEDDVIAVFERHDGMVLSLDDISARQINWNPKSDGIRAIAAELNIGVDSLVFVDDNAFELAEVASALPELRCLQVPDELAALPTLLSGSGLFRRIRVSGEDRHRTEMMRAEARRRSELETMDHDQFLASLELCVTVVPVAEEHITRVAQLTNKTNQFNLTTIRRDENQIRGLVASENTDVYAIRVTDRFGDYGMVGVAVVERDRETSTIETLLLSCRVLARGVESAFLAAIADDAVAHGSTRLVGRYEPTPKNSQVATFYADHGFEPDPAAPGRFRLDLHHHRPQIPVHIARAR
jgi:FkbH-like protein